MKRYFPTSNKNSDSNPQTCTSTSSNNLQNDVVSVDDEHENSQKMPAPSKKRTCKFNKSWLEKEEFKVWLRDVRENEEMARCIVCKSEINVKWDGNCSIK